MGEGDDAAWIARAIHLDDFHCDTLFAIRTGIQFCDPVTGHFIPGATVTLPVTDLPSVRPGFTSGLSLLGREDALARHYLGIVTAFADHGRSGQLRGGDSCFWLMPAIIAQGDVVTQFVWYDDVQEAAALLQALIDAPRSSDEVIWDDMDQGWCARILKVGGTTYVAEWDWEDETAIPAGYAFDTMALARQAADGLARLRTLHGYLVNALGRDYWIYQRR